MACTSHQHMPTANTSDSESGRALTADSCIADPKSCAAIDNARADPAPESGPPQIESCKINDEEGQRGDGHFVSDAVGAAAVLDQDPAGAAAQGTGSAVTHLLTQRFMPQRQIAAIRADGSINVWREDGGHGSCQPLS